eukprot:12280998-Karenia_brevis.AAC.1
MDIDWDTAMDIHPDIDMDIDMYKDMYIGMDKLRQQLAMAENFVRKSFQSPSKILPKSPPPKFAQNPYKIY